MIKVVWTPFRVKGGDGKPAAIPSCIYVDYLFPDGYRIGLTLTPPVLPQPERS